MITLNAISRLGVRDVWPLVVDGLNILYADHKGPWMPEDVYAELVAGRATLYMIDRDDTNKGFFIARAHHDFDGVVLFIWILFVESHTVDQDELLPEIEKLAKAVGARRIRHESKRNGWVKRGFELKMKVYEREV
jgi:hypothetical protein